MYIYSISLIIKHMNALFNAYELLKTNSTEIIIILIIPLSILHLPLFYSEWIIILFSIISDLAFSHHPMKRDIEFLTKLNMAREKPRLMFPLFSRVHTVVILVGV